MPSLQCTGWQILQCWIVLLTSARQPQAPSAMETSEWTMYPATLHSILLVPVSPGGRPHRSLPLSWPAEPGIVKGKSPAHSIAGI
ncbi:hypothetical protein E2C01_092272 [Portunus trituberculatus]|uniref:Uncharacterized protein n=1 Tax=Portunus trituberculatus TaxID=210409 RepID=A0A5B7JRK5_PORTR|nr:hypothetical protein [Portunus trituberculatus]